MAPSKILAKPGAAAPGLKPGVTEERVAALIAGAPDSKQSAPARQAEELEPEGMRKIPISLTIDRKLLRELDRKAKALGISRAAAFALAASRFIAAEEREASR